MSDGDANATAADEARGPNDHVTPVDGAFRVVFIVLLLELAIVTATTAPCGPLEGLVIGLFFFLITPYVAVPLELVVLGTAGFTTLAILRTARRTGRRRIWYRAQLTAFGIWLAALIASTMMLVSGSHGGRCLLH